VEDRIFANRLFPLLAVDGSGRDKDQPPHLGVARGGQEAHRSTYVDCIVLYRIEDRFGHTDSCCQMIDAIDTS